MLSTTGFLIRVCGGAVCWKSVKQKCIAMSSCEAELIAANAAADAMQDTSSRKSGFGTHVVEEHLCLELVRASTIVTDDQDAVYVIDGALA